MPDIYAGSHDTDFTPPRVENPTPIAGSSQHLVTVVVGFDIVDDTFYGVDLNNTTVRIAGEVAYQSGSWQPGYSGTIGILSNGYRFRITQHPDLIGLVFVQIDSQDTAPVPNVMDSYVWSFSTEYDTVSKAFLFNTLATQADGASSYFQPKVSNIVAGSKGNTAMAARAISSLAVGNSYQLKTILAGHFDTDLDYVRERTEELGTGQVTYTETRNFRGSYSPPGFIVDDGTNKFGMETTFTKHIFAKNAAQRYTSTVICDRDDDSFFVFANHPGTGASTVYSVPKIGRTDVSPVSGASLSLTVHAACKISDGKYIVVYAQSRTGGTDSSLVFRILDETGTVVETPNNFVPIRRDEVTTTGYKGCDIIARDNILYLVFSYGSDVATRSSFRVYFARSFDEGKTWEMLNGPGTNKLALIPTTIYDEIKDSTYVGQLYPKVSWDFVEQKFILSFLGYHTTPGYRCVTCISDNFSIWSRFNFPVFKTAIAAGGSTIDMAAMSGINRMNRIVRHGGMFFGIGRDEDGQYICRFMNDDSTYGTRRGMFWCEDPSSGTPPEGAIIFGGDFKEIDNIVYLATTVNSSGNEEGFVVHAYGALTNLPDDTLYSCAYFGNQAEPDEDYNWTQNTTGSPVITPGDTGLRLQGAASEYVYFNRTDFPYDSPGAAMNGGMKCKFIVKPVSDNGPNSTSAQRVFCRLPTTSSGERCDFSIRMSTTGIVIWDEIGSSSTTYSAAISDFVQVMFVYMPVNANSATLRVFVAPYGNGNDEWTQIANMTLVSKTDSTQIFSWGLTTTNTSGVDSDAYWKALYYCDRVDNTDYDVSEYTDNIEAYSQATDENDLTPIPMAGEETYQAIVDGIEVAWRGTDSYEGDTWNFEVDTDFSADNILNKCPALIWRSGANTASGLGTMTAEYIDFDADNDDFGMFVFNTFVFLNTNFRFAKLQANNDGTSWSPADYEQDINLEIETGTTANPAGGPYTRSDSDLMTIWDTTKNWLVGEFVGKYVQIEEILELGLSGAPTNYYKNCAFKILENGTDYLVVSTKGLLVDELGTGGSKLPMYVQPGKAYSIYDTRISAITDGVQAYRYVRIQIIASKSYSDAWTTSNQPNLPNERSWSIGEFDIGVRVELQSDADYGYDTVEDSNTDIQRQDDGGIVVNRKGVPIRTFTITYSLLVDYDHDILENLFEAISESDKPFWYAPYIEEEPFKVYLVNIYDKHDSKKFLPEHQEDDIVLEEVV